MQLGFSITFVNLREGLYPPTIPERPTVLYDAQQMKENSESANRISQHLIRNEELLRIIQKKGFSIDEIRIIECHFWSPDEFNAKKLSAELQKQSFTQLRMNQTTDSGVWNLEMAVHQTARSVASKEFTTQISNTADRFECVYDGWGTTL